LEKVLKSIFLIIFTLIFLGGDALAYTIEDDTDVGIGLTSETAEKHHGMTDVLGEDHYNTYGINVSFSGYEMTLDLFTRFDGTDTAGNVTLELADIFFDSGSGYYDYAYDIGENKIYSGVDSYTTSEDIFKGISGGPWYYGRYWGTEGTDPSPIVERLNGNHVSRFGPSSFSSSTPEGINQYTVSFDFRNIIGVNPGILLKSL